MKTLKDVLDAINTDGGHILIALILVGLGLFCSAFWKIPEGKELFLFAMGILGLAMKSTGRANGKPVEKE